MTARIDWFRVLVDLSENGWSKTRVAAHLGRSDGWVMHLKNSPDADPRHRDGEELLSLWADVTGNRPAYAPRNQSGMCARIAGRCRELAT